MSTVAPGPLWVRDIVFVPTPAPCFRSCRNPDTLKQSDGTALSIFWSVAHCTTELLSPPQSHMVPPVFLPSHLLVLACSGCSAWGEVRTWGRRLPAWSAYGVPRQGPASGLWVCPPEGFREIRAGSDWMPASPWSLLKIPMTYTWFTFSSFTCWVSTALDYLASRINWRVTLS